MDTSPNAREMHFRRLAERASPERLAIGTALEPAGVRYASAGSWVSTAFGELRFMNDAGILAGFTAESPREFPRALPRQASEVLL